MKNIVQTQQFKKDLKRYRHRTDLLQDLYEALRCLRAGESLPMRYSPHQLKGKLRGCMECHIRGDLLLIWVDEDSQTIRLLRFGTHHEILGI